MQGENIYVPHDELLKLRELLRSRDFLSCVNESKACMVNTSKTKGMHISLSCTVFQAIVSMLAWLAPSTTVSKNSLTELTWLQTFNPNSHDLFHDAVFSWCPPSILYFLMTQPFIIIYYMFNIFTYKAFKFSFCYSLAIKVWKYLTSYCLW